MLAVYGYIDSGGQWSKTSTTSTGSVPNTLGIGHRNGNGLPGTTGPSCTAIQKPDETTAERWDSSSVLLVWGSTTTWMDTISSGRPTSTSRSIKLTSCSSPTWVASRKMVKMVNKLYFEPNFSPTSILTGSGPERRIQKTTLWASIFRSPLRAACSRFAAPPKWITAD